MYAPFGSTDGERLYAVSNVRGSYFFSVQLPDWNKAGTEISVELVGLRKATAQDQTRVEALSAFLQGDEYRNQTTEDDQKCAVKEFQKALTLFSSINDRRGEAQTRNYLTFSLAGLEDFDAALAYVLPAIDIWESLRDPYGAAEALNNAAFVYSAVGESEKASEAYKRAVPLWREVQAWDLEAATLLNLGIAYQDLGRYEEARDTFNEGLKTLRKAEVQTIPALESNFLKQLGITYYYLKEFDKAEKHFKQAVELFPENTDPGLKAATFNAIAAIYIRNNDYKTGMSYLDSAQSVLQFKDQSPSAGHKTLSAIILNSYGKVYLEIKAIEDKEKAFDYFKKSLAILDALNTPNEKIAVLYNLARAQRQMERPAAAKASIEEALQMLETLRLKINRREFRQSYFARRHFYYRFYIDLLMQLHKENPSGGYADEAFRASERARGRTLFDLLLAKEGAASRELSKEVLSKVSDEQLRLTEALRRRRQLLTSAHTPEQAAAADEEVRKRVSSFEALQKLFRNSRAAFLIQLKPIDLEGLRELLDDKTIALEYSIGEARSYLWAITKSGPPLSLELPVGSEDLNRAVTRLRTYVTARNCRKKNETDAQRKRRIDEADRAYADEAAQLSKILLGPVREYLGANRLIIIADGPLQLVPFAALPVPASDATPARATDSPAQTLPPLMVDHEVVYLPSASILEELRHGAESRPRPKQTIAIYADPVFSASDPRVRRGTGRARATATVNVGTGAGRFRESTRGADCLPATEEFERLTGTAAEADSIIATLGPSRMKKLALGFKASVPTLKAADLSQFQFLHFATHAYVPAAKPEQASLILSLVTERGEPQEGRLGLPDIYQLELNADLVTLSACETGLGKDVEDEGVVGIARGFMYAGTSRVAASLWKVEDDATAELMAKFYQGIFEQKLSPSAALRRAQREMYQNPKKPEWKLPFFWGAFVLQGDWRFTNSP